MAQHRIWRALVDCEGMITGYGHVIGAKQGEDCPVPVELESEARRYMRPVDELEPEAKPAHQAETPVVQDSKGAFAGDVRTAAIDDALETISARNDPEDFAARTGLPKMPIVRDHAGIDDLKIDEVRERWAALQQAVTAA